MRICILSDFVRTGGAAVAADRLAHAFHRQGHEIHRIASDAPDHSSPIREHTLFLGRKFLLLQNLFALSGKPHWADGIRRKELVKQLRGSLRNIRPEIINFHNLHGAAWPLELAEVALLHAPVAWTLHDCWSFLGAYYPSHCREPSPATIRKTTAFWQRRNQGSPRHALAAATPSRWMAEQARTSHWKGHLVEPISNTHPTDSFRPLPKRAAKETLGLSTDIPIVLLAAGNLSEERKGGALLAQMLANTNDKSVQFLTVGHIEKETIFPRNTHHFGFVSDEKLMVILYAAADLLLHLAPIDNLPNTVAEASCCGLPTLAFVVGGLPEMINNGQTGWLASLESPLELPRLLTSVIKNKGYKQKSELVRNHALSLYEENSIVSSYVSLFEKLKKGSSLTATSS